MISAYLAIIVWQDSLFFLEQISVCNLLLNLILRYVILLTLQIKGRRRVGILTLFDVLQDLL